MGWDRVRGVEMMYVQVRRMKTIHVLVVGMCRAQEEMGAKTVCVQVMKVGSVLANGVEMGVKVVRVQVMKVDYVLVIWVEIRR